MARASDPKIEKCCTYLTPEKHLAHSMHSVVEKGVAAMRDSVAHRMLENAERVLP